ETGAEFGIGEDADEGFVEFGGVAGRSEKYAGISDRPSGLRAGKRDHGHPGGYTRDGAAAAGGDRGAHEEQHIGGAEAIDHLLIIEHTFRRYFHGQILQAFTKRSFAGFWAAWRTAARIIFVSRAPGSPPVMMKTPIVGMAELMPARLKSCSD